MNTRNPITSTGLGYDAFGRKVTLFTQTFGDGTRQHSIKAEPRTFREQPQLLEGLTDANLKAIAAALVGEAAR